MNAKLFLGISALALAGAVSAQTVPAEQWVGAPIPAASHFSRAEVAADLSASRSTFASAPAEYRVGPADAKTGAASRAEVAADERLWIRSGMSQVANRDNFDPNSAEYRQQMAAYQRMRNGPEFMAEVQRAQSTRSMSLARFGHGSSAAE
ncbi:hypothetical protein [Variovorax sp. YR216]|uniref:hypothetical protein n=1 Tax=Variovorax sp. YR216 TaxID=1882828 RepID=UPI00089B1A23|nr:hypothetical protein [Variovorax sp. YR216]SEA12512.1 hypothetical protein SAMN05444680_101597 [Variovorax sp. YR216]